jgi:hypothetical protein
VDGGAPRRVTMVQQTAKPQLHPREMASGPVPAGAQSNGGPGPKGRANRESRITIGRVEVQVDNHSAAAAPRPAGRVRPTSLNQLEARYLNRFPLRP